MRLKGISVIICCYNSSTRIAPTLYHLASQRGLSGIPWEIIIVNNCSNDNTTINIQLEWSKYNSSASFIIIEEPRQGVAYARKTGSMSARYEYIIFCDDDNWFCPDYLKVAFDTMENKSAIGIISGKSIGQSSIDFPYWWDEYKINYAAIELSTESGDISHLTYFWTAGLVIRKELILKVFDDETPLFLTGRMGLKLTSGEDSEICLRILLLKYSAFYEKKLEFVHFISPERLQIDYRDKLVEGGLLANAVLDKYVIALKQQNHSLFIKLFNTLYLLFKLSINRLNLFRESKTRIYLKLYTYWQKDWITEDTQIKSILKFVKKHS